MEVLRRFGFEVYYGDITRLDLLEAAGAGEAELLIITIGDVEKARQLVKLARKHYPHLQIAANAADRAAVYDLMDLGVATLRRETFGSALSLGCDALQLLGFPPYEAYRLMRLFRKKDEETLPELYRINREDRENYATMYQKHNEELEELITLDMAGDMEEIDNAWAGGNPES